MAQFVPDPPQPLDDVVSDVLLSRRLKARRQLDPGEEPGAQEHCGALSAEGSTIPTAKRESPDQGAQEFVGDEVAGHRPSTRDRDPPWVMIIRMTARVPESVNCSATPTSRSAVNTAQIDTRPVTMVAASPAR